MIIVSMAALLAWGSGAWVWAILCRLGELDVYKEHLARGVGMDMLVAAQDKPGYVIPRQLPAWKPTVSDYYGFQLVLRSGFSPRFNQRREVIGYYVQTQEIPWWMLSSQRVMALELREDLGIEEVGLATAIAEIRHWGDVDGPTTK